jgi:hypothetical protein
MVEYRDNKSIILYRGPLKDLVTIMRLHYRREDNDADVPDLYPK